MLIGWLYFRNNNRYTFVKYPVHICPRCPSGPGALLFYREIEESAFVIADLTVQRGGVYYEAETHLHFPADMLFYPSNNDQ